MHHTKLSIHCYVIIVNVFNEIHWSEDIVLTHWLADCEHWSYASTWILLSVSSVPTDLCGERVEDSLDCHLETLSPTVNKKKNYI